MIVVCNSDSTFPRPKKNMQLMMKSMTTDASWQSAAGGDFDDSLHEVPVSVANARVVVVPCLVDYREAGHREEAHLVIAREHCRGERVRGAALRRLAAELARTRGAPVCVDVDGVSILFN